MHTLRQQENTQQPDFEASDGHLITQACAGDQHAFEALVNRYRDTLFRYSHTILKEKDMADDVLQFVFLQLYLSLPTLTTSGSLKAWLFRVTRNRCFDMLRKRRSEPVMCFSALVVEDLEDDNSLIEGIMDPNSLPEEIVMMLEIQSILRRALFTLPPSLHTIVYLHSFRHLSFTEIARILNLPPSRVKTYFYRSLPRLHDALMKDISFIDHLTQSELVSQ
ncbi:RNA polymerase subunit sigma-24 [Dictyobacter alpinus]|uniref:RNA polymerase subunit sigma-24 n=1 Tax=Dictyobacter alpinus TaxID=2014873 RepID=A0A402B153_9CHLR|nr:RNA polymerase sigma factor [Dictyobacter alpinus]GCE25068.1 RNA polymerase subunit sigma-24 [Dictyobacter alpinus]